MFGLGKRRNVVLQFQTPAHEPSAAERQNEAYRARIGAASQIIVAALAAQHRLYAENRNLELIDALLDLRTALALGPGGGEIPVVPGRSS